MALLQEKFQTVAPQEKRGVTEWVSSGSARRAKSPYPQHVTDSGLTGTVLNCLPPGDNIGDQYFADQPAMPRVMSGEGDVTPTTRDHFSKGYKRFDVKPTDDAYTAEHVDTFYGEAVSDGQTGFVERGNLLDRI